MNRSYLQSIADISSLLQQFIKKEIQNTHYPIINNFYSSPSEFRKKYNLDSLAISSGMTKYFGVWCYELQQTMQIPLILITPNEEQAIHLYKVLTTYQQDNTSILHLPSWSMYMGEEIPEHAHIRTARSVAIHMLAQKEYQIIICSIAQWNQLLPPKKKIIQQSILLNKGSTSNINDIIASLVQWNYLRVPKVSGEGEFSFRGEVLDIYIQRNINEQENSHPIRITFDFESIESIKYFDITSQLTITQELEEVYIPPRSEYIWNSESIDILSKNIGAYFPEVSSRTLENTVLQLTTHAHDNYDYFYGVWGYENPEHLLHYCAQSPLILYTHFESLEKQKSFYWNTQEELFSHLSHYLCVPHYGKIRDLIREHTDKITPIPIYTTQNMKNAIVLNDKSTQKFSGNLTYFISYLKEHKDIQQTYLVIEHKETIERMLLLLGSQLIKDTQEEMDREAYIGIIREELGLELIYYEEQGNTLSEFSVEGETEGILEIFSEIDLMGKKIQYISSDQSAGISSIFQIEEGEYVVHIQYGIGKFIGLTRMNIKGIEKDYIRLEYAHKEILYVPIEQLNLLQRYIGEVHDRISLDSIGGKNWEQRKAKTLQKIEDMSEELLSIQAQRSQCRGFSFPSGEEWEQQFIRAFPYEETEDQIHAWQEISNDMDKHIPMDRLVVGDVGFGKTELAFRAMFRAICAGKQAMFLVPTTILAEQHYYSALTRFEEFPVRIAMLSRFLNRKEQKKVIEELSMGTIDIVIGTHRILQKDIVFKDLGICIIDEEHRFGVKDKEHIKHYRTQIDCLALSATPIPRTMYQSIVKLRDISVLRTPPEKRLPIKTYVERFNSNLIHKAIESELQRGGQVFYLHNRIATLTEVKKFIETLVPTATVLVANGQMPAKDLEDTMYRFINKSANVLVSTTIIENGIDIPNVNTIIIDRADNYGIAQLYQLRGRVGRSDKRAYAYLLYPDNYHISEIALKRLQVISDHTELGSGFEISMQDMQARGSGNLLGKEQSGSIIAIGYEQYMKLLDETMRRIQGQEIPQQDTVLELSFTGYIPDTYIQDSITKMDLYKKIASVQSLEEYHTLEQSTKDMYGTIPQEITNLFWIARLRILCTKYYVHTLKDTPKGIELHFSKMATLPIEKITDLLEKGMISMKSTHAHVLVIQYKQQEESTLLEKKYQMLNTFFESLA